MKEKSVRHLSKTELLELLRSQEEELQDVKAKNKELEEQLKDRKIEIANAGSIAEASLAVNKIFEAAQLAADQYLMNLQRTTDRDLEHLLRMKADMENQLRELKTKTDEECLEREEREKRYVDALWHALEKKLDEYEKTHPASHGDLISDIRREMANGQIRQSNPGKDLIE